MTDYQKLRTLIEEELWGHDLSERAKLAASILRAIQPAIEQNHEQIVGWMGVEDIDGNVVLTQDPRWALKLWVVGDPFPVYRKKSQEPKP